MEPTPPQSADPLVLQARIDHLEEVLSEAGMVLESLTALQLQMEDEAQGWIRLDGSGAGVLPLSTIRRIGERMYVSYHGSPLTHRAITITTDFVWGRGVTMASPQRQVQEAITDFLEEPTNMAELGHVGRTEKEMTLRIQGNLFLALFTNTRNGEVLIRTIPFEDVTDLISDPNDYRRVKFIARTLPGQGGEIVYHPALGYEPPEEERPERVNDHRVIWNAPVLHMALPRVCRETWGVPDLACTLVWSRTYSRFLSNIASIHAALAQIALLATGKTPASLAALTAVFSTGTDKPAIPTASSAILPDGTSITPFKTSGQVAAADDGRMFMMMVSAGSGVPEHILQGDPATGNLATSKTMERPYELTVMDRQLGWADAFEQILTYVVRMRALAEDCEAITGIMEKNAFGRWKLIIRGAERVSKEGTTVTADEPPEINVKFPAVLEHDTLTAVDAIMKVFTNDDKKPAGMLDYATAQRLFLQALDEPDIDDMIANMDDDDIRAQREALKPVPPPPAGNQPPGNGPPDQNGPPEQGNDDTATWDGDAADALKGDGWRGLLSSLRTLIDVGEAEA